MNFSYLKHNPFFQEENKNEKMQQNTLIKIVRVLQNAFFLFIFQPFFGRVGPCWKFAFNYESKLFLSESKKNMKKSKLNVINHRCFTLVYIYSRVICKETLFSSLMGVTVPIKQGVEFGSGCVVFESGSGFKTWSDPDPNFQTWSDPDPIWTSNLKSI